jgi:hypothetical protein
MQTSPSFLTDEQKPKPEPIPYSPKSLRQDLDRVRSAWAKSQRRRRRDAIYTYLSAVYDLVTWWIAEGRAVERARRALRSRLLEVPEREDPFAAIIASVQSTRVPEIAHANKRCFITSIVLSATASIKRQRPQGLLCTRKCPPKNPINREPPELSAKCDFPTELRSTVPRLERDRFPHDSQRRAMR